MMQPSDYLPPFHSPATVEASLHAAGITEKVVSVTPLAGGVSNLTYRVERNAADPIVLRLQRSQGIFEPYDVLREARVLQALAQTTIPVPRVLATNATGKALGAPFFAMEYVTAPHAGMVGFGGGVAEAYVRMVAAIHAVPWTSPALAQAFAFLNPPQPGTEAATRDLALVHARALTYGCANDPLIHQLHDQLKAHLPLTSDLALCQGDINSYNYLIGNDAVVAVIDWEQAHIGDRRSDLGLLAALATLRGAAGPPARLTMIARYAAVTEFDPRGLTWFALAGLHKLAVVHRIWVRTPGPPPWYAWTDVQAAAAKLQEEFARETDTIQR